MQMEELTKASAQESALPMAISHYNDIVKEFSFYDDPFELDLTPDLEVASEIICRLTPDAPADTSLVEEWFKLFEKSSKQ